MTDFSAEYVAAFDSINLEPEPDPVEEKEQQSFGGDVVDAFQKGTYQGVAGLGEISEQVTGYGEGLRDWAQEGADAQDITMSDDGLASMGKEIFSEDAEGNIEFGEGAGDIKTWVLGLSNVAGQYVDLLAGGAGLARGAMTIGGKAVFKSAAKAAAKRGAAPEVAEAMAKRELEKFMVANAGRANVTAFGGVGGAMAQGQAAIEARSYTMDMSNDELNKSQFFIDEFYEIYEKYPSNDPELIADYRKQAQQNIAEKAATAVAFDPALLASNVLTELIGGKFLDGVLRGVGTGGRLSNSAKGFVQEGATETFQGGVEKLSINKAVQENSNQDQELMDGVLSGALNEGVMGGAMGAAMGGISPGRAEADQDNTDNSQAQSGEGLEQSAIVEDAQFENLDLGNNPMPALPAGEQQAPANDESTIYAGEGEAWAAPRLTDQQEDVIAVPAVDESQIAGNKNNGMEGEPTVVGHTNTPKPKMEDIFSRYEAAKAQELEAKAAGVDYEQVTIDSTSNLELEPKQSGVEYAAQESANNRLGDKITDAIRKERMPEGLDNDARILRAPFRNELNLAKSHIDTLRKNKTVTPASDSLVAALGKIGGLNIKDMVSEGIDHADMTAVNKVSFESTFTKNGLSLDAAAESLAQHGYLRKGNIKQQLLDKVNDSLRGQEHYSEQVDYDTIQSQVRFKAVAGDVKSMGYKGFTRAMDKAMKGQKLGQREARVVKTVMDTLSGERQEYLETTVRPMRDRVLSIRKMAKDGVDLFNSPAYKVELDRRNDPLSQAQDTDAMAEVIVEALESGLDRSIVDRAIEKADGDMVYAGTMIDEAMAGNLAPLDSKTTLDDFFGVDNGRSNHAEENASPVTGRPEALPSEGQPVNGPAEESLSSDSKQAGSETETDGSFLTSYTEEDLAKEEQQRLEAEKQEQTETKATEGKAKADTEAKDFSLSGSDTPADLAASQGQEDLLSQPEAKQVGPSDAQKEAGNYKKKHVRMHGLEISIENQAGSIRSGTDENGDTWENEIHYDYGDIKGTVGADNDPIDVFIGKNLTGTKVFVVNQTHPNGSFDEHKVMFGFGSKDAAEAGYLKNYDDNWSNYDDVVETTVDDFKAWLKGDTKKPFSEIQKETQAPQDQVVKENAGDRIKAKVKSKSDYVPKIKEDHGDIRATWTYAMFPAKYKEIHNKEGAILSVELNGEDLDSSTGYKSVAGIILNGKVTTEIIDKLIDRVISEHKYKPDPKPTPTPKTKGEKIKSVVSSNPEAVKSKSSPTKRGTTLDNKAEEKFEDFGEKLEGAKKHTFAFSESLSSNVDVSSEPLSRSFPQPDYEKLAASGVDPKKLAFIAHLRALIPSKPRVSYKVERWAKKVELFRDSAVEVMTGSREAGDFIKSMGADVRGSKYLGSVFALADGVLPSQIIDLGQFGLSHALFQNYHDQKNVYKWIVTAQKSKGFRGLSKEEHFDTEPEALAFIKSLVTVTGKDDKPLAKFDMWTMRGGDKTVFVGKKIATGKYIELAEFKSSKEAREHIVNHNAELVELLKNKKKIGSHRRTEQNERIGKDYRRGENVTSDLFASTFEFRGVQFGNYVENDRRQQDLNNAYDGLLDLADVIGVPPQALSLNGELGLAFGARGSGGKDAAAAHYEPGTVVINLTKKQGAGSLAHEWFHALDGYFARAALDGGDGHITELKRPKRASKMVDGVPTYGDLDPNEYGVRPEVYDAFKALTKAIQDDTQIIQRSVVLDNRKSKAYWITVHELTARAFERYVIDKLAKDGYESDYLATILPKDVWDDMEKAMGNEAESYPYPTDSEAKLLFGKYENVFSEIKVKDTGKGTALYRLDKNPATERDFSFKGKVKSWVKHIEQDLGEKITVVESYKDLPKAIQSRFGDRIRGAYHDGKMYLVANKMLDEAMAVETALHEMLGHHGVMSYLGKDLEPTIKQIYKSLGKRAFRDLAKRYNLDLDTEAGKREAVLEMIAHAAETGKRANLLHRFIAALRAALRKAFPQLAWTDTDILVLIDRSRVAMKDSQLNNSNSESLAKLDDEVTSDQFNDLNENQKSFLNKIGRPTIQQAAIHKIKELMDGWRLKVRQGLVDRFAALVDLDKSVHGENVIKENTTQSSWARSRLSNAASGVIAAMMDGGRVFLDPADGVIDVKEDTSGLVHTLNKLGSAAEVERFMGWIAANRSSKLAAEGRENLFNEDEISAGMRLHEGTLDDGRGREALYAEVFNEFQIYRDDVLAIAEKAGVITPEAREMWANEFYVPFYRVMEDMDDIKGPTGTGGISRQQAITKLKGGTEELNDLLQNTLMNFHHLVDASLKNLAAQQAIKNGEKAGIAQRVPESRKSDQSTFILKDGQKIWYDISDEMVFTAITSLSSTGMNSAAMKVMRAFKRVFTNFTTSSPQFMVANLIRDSLHAVAVTPLGANIPKNAFGGMKTYMDDYQKARLNATGGAFHFGHAFGEDASAIKWGIDKHLNSAGFNVTELRDPTKVWGLVSKAWDKWQGVGNVLENSNRAAAFKQNESKGKMHAALEARDLMDFSAHGAWPAIRILIDVVPFLNARLQGLDKMWREGVKPGAKVIREMLGIKDASVSDKQAAKRFTAVVGSLAMVSIALYLHNQDDEEYQKLEDWQKDTYWYFRIGDNAFFIPKPFEVGAIATMAERMTEQMVNDKATGKLFAERMGHMLGDTFSFNPVPQMFQPMLDIYSNKDAFTGRDIESMGQQRLSPSMRVRANTTSLAKGASALLENSVGAAFGNDSKLVLSPVQIDHMIGGYLGWLGSSVSAGADSLVKAAMGETTPDKGWYEYQPMRRFYRNLSLPGYTKVQTQFYDTLRELNQTHADIQEYKKLGMKDEAKELYQDSKGKLGRRNALAKVQRKLGKINRRIKLIAASNNSGEWKRREKDKLMLIKNRIMEQISSYVE